ncbi:PEP/pyruvate-binding domain-containing protein [Hyalangium gracile]|uniref:PEP/pyruvate-binding domain-containing protein n=1 Tax=Hyalangium gracile TaxID=394092 RepID=UPI001CCA98B7|nr:PEP/pyruvate-binding domain-containing protein [Hyalangium gracile]
MREGDYAHTIDTPEVWHALAARPGSEFQANIEVVKVVLDSMDGNVYFMQSERWPLHLTFARRFLFTFTHPVPPPSVFYEKEYRSKERRFVLGTLAHYVDADVWAFELSANDTLDVEATARAFSEVRKRVFFREQLRYRPVPPAHERELARLQALMPVVTVDAIAGKTRYQPLEMGEAYGYLRVFPVGRKVEPRELRPYDIVVLAELPEELPVVAGVMSEQLQAPLGHINVLCHNRRTPNMSARGLLAHPSVKQLENQLVHLVVEPRGFRLEPATLPRAESAWEAHRPARPFTPERDDRDVGMPLLTEMDPDDVSLFGAKAAQLARVAQLSPSIEVPKGFGLPFHAYARFLRVNGLDARIEAMLADPEFQRSPDKRQRDLQALREAMERAPVPPDILQPLLARIRAVLPPGKVRLRSSTNAEDLPGFNGAGLYRSRRVDPTNAEQVAQGLREVWSSVWLWSAFEERWYYRIEPRTVGMAILVQQSVDDTVANGVAITANPFHQGRPGFLINAQLSGGSVTGARGDELPEQILYYTFEEGRGFERLSRSSGSPDAPILSDEDVEKLSTALGIIHNAFTQDGLGVSGRAVDVEFLLVREPRRVVIVQARPYTVTWEGDRVWRDETGRPVLPP